VPHRIAHRVTLRIEHRRLWHYDDLHFHRLTIFAAHTRTSAIRRSLLAALLLSNNVAGLFILAQSEEDWRAQFSIAGPFGEFDFANEHGI
jgi:hypothetical protein